MERIWAPWRVEYIRTKNPPGCIFCDKPRENKDAGNYILYRGKLNFIILNSFPYNPGHLMVVPFRHIGQLEELTADERCEHYEIVTRAVGALRQAVNSENFNIGMNLGRVAGAGIADHIHTHVVPRWNGDNNFMPVIGETRVISDSLENIYSLLKKLF
ncbi:MAG: family hydrolase [Chloroflexi bacterium]|nr:family hydrolase [Chloroflexota bacterium]